ncbi:MAG TPA: ribonuclease Y [bacterium]|nr:ribonuclease Y [Myxococcales bacterium]OQA59619.1 MAG: Ribonuclease Y [bacterium ADurb.Bin270]HPW45674.1 ribonuclease Y [bacterium]
MTVELWQFIMFVVAAVVLGLLVGSLIRRRFSKRKMEEAEAKASALVKEASYSAENIKKDAELEAKDIKLKARSELERESQEKLKELQAMEKRLQLKEDNLEKKFNLLEKKEEELHRAEQSNVDRKKHAEALEKRYMELVTETRKQLEQIAGISSEEAKRQLIDSMVEEAKQNAARFILEIEERSKEDAQKKSRHIIATAMERMASDYVAERAISVVQLPNDEMKGRIIGREGRNIRALEAATGIDVVIDDTPEAVILSGFNPVRREVARIAVSNLIADGRIHPTRIEEMVEKAEKEVDATIKEAGEQLCLELNVPNLHPELVKLLGSLKYRYSFAQNVLQHTKEVAYIAGMMASELGIDEAKARRAGLLHDIGKAVSHEVEGSHALIGMEYAKKYREDQEVVHAIGAHHEDIEQNTVLDLVIDAADALSGARPGARREVLEAYVKRVEDLEKISQSFKGVSKAYAIQAGREVRVMVVNDQVSDAEAVVLSKDIAKKIESEMTYPGQIKVTVIRETRATEFAK